MMKNKVVLRADGGPNIGMGHFVRTLALGEMLQDDFQCIYATKLPADQQKKEIYQVCDELIELPEDDSHFNKFLKCLDGDEIVVLDNYYFDTEYQKKIKDIGCKLVCIDDMHDKHYVADVVINHAEGLKPEMFSVNESTNLCLGYKYALLRKPFYENNTDAENKFDLMIGIGGTDAYDFTNKIVTNILKNDFNNRIAVLVGSTYNGSVRELSMSQIKIFRGASADEISNLMNQSTFGIFPASTIAIEAIAMRLPFIVGFYVDNQLDNFKGIINNNLGLEIGNLYKLEEAKLIYEINKLKHNSKIRKNIIESQSKYFDKKSPQRLLKVFNSLS